MHICMRTTLNLDDGLLREAKKMAVDEGITLTKLIETAVRGALDRRTAAPITAIRDLPVVTGRLRAGVDVSDRESLYDLMDERR